MKAAARCLTFAEIFGRSRDYHREPERSRLRCRDIMTRDLVVATRDTTLVEVARMMKQEDTGVIPVVDYDTPSGNGRTEGERNYEGRNYARGKLNWLNHRPGYSHTRCCRKQGLCKHSSRRHHVG